jgi:anti-sigma regulatory factor (Ser/Thr protein kinase)
MTQTLSVRLLPEPEAVAESRRFVGDVLAVWGVDEMLAVTVPLLADELVTNAILHGLPPIDLTLNWDDPVLRVEVSDSEDELPVMVEPPRPAGDGGYGLLLIEQLSHQWGAARRANGGKIVWFEMNR